MSSSSCRWSAEVSLWVLASSPSPASLPSCPPCPALPLPWLSLSLQRSSAPPPVNLRPRYTQIHKQRKHTRMLSRTLRRSAASAVRRLPSSVLCSQEGLARPEWIRLCHWLIPATPPSAGLPPSMQSNQIHECTTVTIYIRTPCACSSRGRPPSLPRESAPLLLVRPTRPSSGRPPLNPGRPRATCWVGCRAGTKIRAS